MATMGKAKKIGKVSRPANSLVWVDKSGNVKAMKIKKKKKRK